jgi:hypothetical protein
MNKNYRQLFGYLQKFGITKAQADAVQPTWFNESFYSSGGCYVMYINLLSREFKVLDYEKMTAFNRMAPIPTGKCPWGATGFR